jgi:hypothetical protein
MRLAIADLRATAAYLLIRFAMWIYPGLACELAEMGWNAFADVIAKDVAIDDALQNPKPQEVGDENI